MVCVACNGLVSFRWLQAEEFEGEQSGAVPGAVAAGGCVVAVAGAVEHADGHVGDGGEQPPGSASPQPGGVFGEGCVAAVVQPVFDAPVVAVAGEQEGGAGLGGGERGDGQDGLAGDFRAAGRGARGEGGVAAGAGGAAGVRGGGAADGVPVPFDEHELPGAGQLRPDLVWDDAGDADGADFVPAVADFAGGVQDGLVFPDVSVSGGVQAGLVVLEDEHPADAGGVHRFHVPGLGMHRVRRHDDQLLPLASFSFSFSFVAVAVPVVVAVAAVVCRGTVAACEDGVQEGDEAGDLVGFRVDVVLAEHGAGG